MTAAIEELLATASARPNDVAAQIAAAYACDRAGDEVRAVTFYDAAWRLGVPASERGEFAVGYGSTLRNVGRSDDARAVLRARLDEAPDDAAARCFLALALHSAGRRDAALAEMLEVALAVDAAPSGELARYRRALEHYCKELRASDERLP